MIDSAGFLSSDNVSRDQLFSFLKRVDQPLKKQNTDAVGVLAFFETSTRTRVSFEKAGLDLGIRWIHLDARDSSLKKGESLHDTFKTISLYRPQFFVVRHAATGFPHLVHEWTKIPVINAGEGQRDHPTQGLLDVYTLWQINRTKKWKIAIFGDVIRSRVARTDIRLFKLMGYQVSIVDDGISSTRLFAKAFNVKLISVKNLKSVDIVMALRVQKERGSERILKPLGRDDLGKHTLVMHPGPVVIGEDMAYDLCDFYSKDSLVHQQVANGLKIRTRLLADLIESLGKKK